MEKRSLATLGDIAMAVERSTDPDIVAAFPAYLRPAQPVCEERAGVYHGFRLLWKNVEAERWWLSLPVMPTCRLLLEKVRIERADYERRQRILASIGATAGPAMA